MFKFSRNILTYAHGQYMDTFIVFIYLIYEHLCTAEMYVTGLNPDRWIHEFPRSWHSLRCFSILLLPFKESKYSLPSSQKPASWPHLHSTTRGRTLFTVCCYYLATTPASFHSHLFSLLYLITLRMFCHLAVYGTRNSYRYENYFRDSYLTRLVTEAS